MEGVCKSERWDGALLRIGRLGAVEGPGVKQMVGKASGISKFQFLSGRGRFLTLR